jgi:FkbM family methyltransferase
MINSTSKDAPDDPDESKARRFSLAQVQTTAKTLVPVALFFLLCVFLKPSSSEWPKDALPKSSRRINENRKIYIDLGANCGNTYLQRKAQMDDEGWEVYLWEPSPQMFTFFLDDLAKQNPGIRILPYAASVKTEELLLYLHKGQEHVNDKSQFRDQGKCNPKSPYNPSGGSSVFPQALVAGDAVSIQALDFPKWLEQMDIRAGDQIILKIDIEGAEIDILDKMLSKEEKDATICLTEVIEMEFHKRIFITGSELYLQHEEFENSFARRFEEKCFRKVNFKELF